MALVQAFRVTLFYLLLSSSSFFWCLISLVVAPLLPFRQRYRFVVQAWCNCAVWLAKVIVGIRYEVRGVENIPERPCGRQERQNDEAPYHFSADCSLCSGSVCPGSG